MKPSDALMEHREQIRAIIERHPAGNPRVFGSVARGEDTEESDLDIVVVRKPGLSLFGLAEMELAIEELIGFHVDIVTEGQIPAGHSNQVLDGALPL